VLRSPSAILGVACAVPGPDGPCGRIAVASCD
jgi:hypothetical protein